MSDSRSKLQADRQLLVDAEQKGTKARLGAYVKLSGPGWMQSAITLGGGSLSSSLFLGVLAGYSLLWLQPFAMVLGIIMLSAIGYVTMSTGKRPFQAINEHVNPVLGWGWALASLVANMVWAMPQYSLANSVMQQNLLPGLLGADSMLGDTASRVLIAVSILVLTTTVTWSYDRGGVGIKLYEILLKILVGLIVVCFGGVVIMLACSEVGLDWGAIFRGINLDPSTAFKPSAEFAPMLEGVREGFRDYWETLVVDTQRDILISAAATAVGINMTFLFPYTLLRRGWGKEFRGLVTFDLWTGMFIPFVLATSCVVIASANRFHATPHPGLLDGTVTSGKQLDQYRGFLGNRVLKELPDARAEALRTAWETAKEEKKSMPVEIAEAVNDLPPAERELAASLVTRNAQDLAKSLSPFTGPTFANVVFGVGVLGMALSTITLLMLISGFVVCEIFQLPHTGWPYRLGTMAAATGVLGPFVWGDLGFWLAVPTSVFGFMLLPVAYITFFLLMNQKRFLGDQCPVGGRRFLFNVLMTLAAGTATIGSVFIVWKKAGWYGIGAVLAFLALAVFVHLVRRRS